MGAALRLLMTLSGHSVEYAIQQVDTENQRLPYRADVLLLTVRTHCIWSAAASC